MTLAEQRVLAAIAAETKGGAVTLMPGRPRLAELAGVSLRTLDRALARLRRAGTIATRRQRRQPMLLAYGRPLPEPPSARWRRRILRYFDPAVDCTTGRKRRWRIKSEGGLQGGVIRRSSLRSKRRSRTALAALSRKTHARLPLPTRRRQPRRALLPDPDLALLAERLADADEGTVHVLHGFRARGLSEADFATAREALAWQRQRQRIESPVRYLVGVLRMLEERRAALSTGKRLRGPRGAERQPSAVVPAARPSIPASLAKYDIGRAIR